MLKWNNPDIEKACDELIRDIESITDPLFQLHIGEAIYNKEALLEELKTKTEFGLELANNYIKGLNLSGNV